MSAGLRGAHTSLCVLNSIFPGALSTGELIRRFLCRLPSAITQTWVMANGLYKSEAAFLRFTNPEEGRTSAGENQRRQPKVVPSGTTSGGGEMMGAGTR
jgi:hypothetical protein